MLPGRGRLLLGRRYGVEGLALAGVLAMSANALATLLYGRWLHGGPALAPIAAAAARALGIALVAGAAAHFAIGGRSGTLGALLDLAIGGGAFALVAAAGIAVAGDAALRDAGLRLVRRLVRRAPAS